MLRNLLALVGLGAVALATAVGIQASGWRFESDEPRAMSVSFAGLDLATAEGKALLDRRIATAVTRVCGRADIRDLKAMATERKCRRDAWIGAEPQVAAAIDKAESRDRLAAERAQQLAAAPAGAAPLMAQPGPLMVQPLPPGYRPATARPRPAYRKWRAKKRYYRYRRG